MSPAVDYKTHHLLPRLRESPEDAAGYIAAALEDGLDSPETIALAFQDVIDAYNLPIEVKMKTSTPPQGEMVSEKTECLSCAAGDPYGHTCRLPKRR